MSQIVRVLRVHLLTWPGLLAWPWAILATSFGVNLIIFRAVSKQDTDPVTGGLASIYVLVVVVSAQLVLQVFPFALGMGVTRRVFYAATALLVLAGSVAFGAVLYLLSLVERATGGWGESLRFFDLPFMGHHNPVLQILMYVVPLLVTGAVGLFLGVVQRRWGTNGVFALSLIALVVFGGAATLITWLHRWHGVIDWLSDQHTVALIAGWPAVLAVLLAGCGYLALRRATG